MMRIIKAAVLLLIGLALWAPARAQTTQSFNTCVTSGSCPALVNGLSGATQLASGGTGIGVPGAKGDCSTDDSGAINTAIAALPVGGTLLLPPGPGGCYVIKSTIAVHQRSLIGLGGLVSLSCQPVSGATDCMDIWTSTSTTGSEQNIRIENIKIDSTASKFGQDSFRYGGGIGVTFINDVGSESGRDCFHAEADSDNKYSEILTTINVQCTLPTRDSFHFESGNTATVNYINQTYMINPASRGPGRYALWIGDNGTGANQPDTKISQLDFLGGEFDCTGSTIVTDDCAYFSATGSSNARIEYVSFLAGATIEDTTHSHTGWTINGTTSGGGTIGPVSVAPTTILFSGGNDRINPAVFAQVFNASLMQGTLAQLGSGNLESTSALAIVTDATTCNRNAAITGSGSTKCPAWYNTAAAAWWAF